MGAGRRDIAVVVLAAGQGTRMKSRLTKVLHPIAGRPMLDYPLQAAEALSPERIVTVVGRDAEAVRERFEGRCRFVTQEVQRGTGHGAAAPLIAVGGGLGGEPIVGRHPSLTRLDQGALRVEIAFRRVFATVLDRDDAVPGLLQELGRDHPVDRVVLGQQDAQAPIESGAGRWVVRLRSSRLRDRKATTPGEGAAASDLAVDGQPPAHQLDQLARNRETEARAPVPTSRRTVRLAEGVEDLPLFVLGHADPGIDHLDFNIRFTI